MYSTCLACHAPLGANEVLERFPIGRRVAFDQARGRLWAVCAVCRQWNLAGLDERWEAIEAAERLFHDTKLRASTDNIGLARMRDGTELVRIGDPKRPEFAAWRYGERFTRRFRTRAPLAVITGGSAMVLKKLPILVSVQMLQVAAIPLVAMAGVVGASRYIRTHRDVAQVRLRDGSRVRLTQAHVERLRVEEDPAYEGGWRLRVKHSAPEAPTRAYRLSDPSAVFEGTRAREVAAQLLPRVNRIGGRRSTVAEAVEVLERAGSPDAVFRMASWRHIPGTKAPSRYARIIGGGKVASTLIPPGTLYAVPAAVRLAAEMAAHEEQERLLMQGELDSLEDQWREAEEVAAIADELTLPPAILRQLERLRVR